MQLYNKAKKITAIQSIAKYSHTLGTNNTRFNKREVTCFTACREEVETKELMLPLLNFIT